MTKKMRWAGLVVLVVVAVAIACSSGDKTLARQVDEAPGSNCPNGGKKVLSGTDTNGDGVLSDDEVTSTSFNCTGSTGTTLARETSSYEPTAECPYGTKTVERGTDDGVPSGVSGNGLLETGEIERTTSTCLGEDEDRDGLGFGDDKCPGVKDSENTDSDNDGKGDGCDDSPCDGVGKVDCDDTAAVRCVDTRSDSANCGACGQACTSNEICAPETVGGSTVGKCVAGVGVTLHVVHAATGIGASALCVGGAVTAEAPVSFWPDFQTGRLSGGKASGALPQAHASTLRIPGAVLPAVQNLTLVVWLFPLSPTQFDAALAGGGDDGPANDDCAALAASTGTNGGIEIGRIDPALLTMGTAYVAAAVDETTTVGNAVRLRMTEMDAAVPGDATKVGLHFLHHMLNTTLAVDGGVTQLTVAVGGLTPNGRTTGCAFDFVSFGAAKYPEKAPARYDAPLAFFSAPGSDGQPKGRELWLGVDTGASVVGPGPTNASSPCGYRSFPFDLIAASSGGESATAASYFQAGRTYSLIAVGDFTKPAQEQTVTSGGSSGPNPLYYSNWGRFLALPNR
jgi:hypothetical protein